MCEVRAQRMGFTSAVAGGEQKAVRNKGVGDFGLPNIGIVRNTDPSFITSFRYMDFAYFD